MINIIYPLLITYIRLKPRHNPPNMYTWSYLPKANILDNFEDTDKTNCLFNDLLSISAFRFRYIIYDSRLFIAVFSYDNLYIHRVWNN